MKKEDLLQKSIENILIDLKFVDLYKSIWEKYQIENLDYKISDFEILKTFKEIGYIVKKHSDEQYFSDWFTEDDFEYRIGISVKYNIIHFDFQIKNEKYDINSGGDCGLLTQLITNWEMPVKSPKFNNFETFNQLIKDLILLFEIVKKNVKQKIYKTE